ncbi:hypothetical protein QAD02_015419 [Eretmocerus hayati]|uniref:Uncharacterized protein n=1 Tax=Eretmocerus hayati TaxID=131215 RepID=A0ACC2PAZ6_9HYME|nr:hypothetical protein QAD02_015419 [Eretmocerus hayati]
MPADVAMHPNFLHLEKQQPGTSSSLTSTSKQQLDSRSWNTENMSGHMRLQGPGGEQSVQVMVYRTSLEHFAVIYPLQKRMCRPLGVLNLRNTTIERCGLAGDKQGFLVRQKGCDSPLALTFIPEEPADIEYWMLAFTARSSPLVHQSSLPRVEEEEI